MYGHNIYHIGQQIIYTCNEQEIKRLLSNSGRDNDNNNESDNKKNNSNLDKSVILLSRGYRITPGIGAHKLHLNKKSWNKARQTCIDEGGKK